ncbi:uncharacterized protein LOC143624931 [Bidens hawaiensis]|uniref:uncharacterized protein LOC143624931 n=1 Tax=Bidens hawaiensis TaxID=980011 RepID=UPI0040492076
MGVTLDGTLANMTDGVYTFRAHKGIYHNIDQLVSRDGTPRYLQLYFYGPDTELDLRLHWRNINRDITKILTRVLSTNPYVKTFRSLAELGPLDNYKVTLNASVEFDQRVLPAFGLKGMAISLRIKEALLCTADANTEGRRKTVAMREYYCYKFQIRSAENALLFGGRLLQQFGVDVYIKLETSRLHFLLRNQDKIRADLYQVIVDCIHAGEVHPNRIGKQIVLPACFIGGPRDMRRRFLDAMTLVQDDGKPDLFITMTCNPHWSEICDNLKPGQTAQYRPELVSRVFRAKLEDLKEQLLKKHLLGEVKAYIYVIEFQKRGLPHAHILLIMYPQ